MATVRIRNLLETFTALLVGGAGLMAFDAGLANTAHSNAAGLHAELAYRGHSIHLAAGHVSGRASGAYDFATTTTGFQEDKSGTPVELSPRLNAVANTISTHVASSSVSGDQISSQGDVSVADAQLEALINPPPVSRGSAAAPQPPPVAMLTLTAHQVSSSAYYTKVFPGGITADGTATIGSLKLTGSVFGTQAIKYSGTPAPNTVIFDSPALTVTLNKQIEPALSLCPKCAPQPVSIEVVAVDILLKHVVAYGRVATGEVRLASSAAR